LNAPPLAGRSVVVTRARSEAPALADRLVRLGATVVELPVIAIEDPVDGGEALSRAAHRLSAGAYQWVAFTSSNAVSRFLAAGLRSKGWVVDEVIAYRTVAAHPGAAAIESAARSDAVLFTSSSTVERAIEVLGPAGIPPVIVTIGPVTSRSARSAGLRVAGEASPHTVDGLVDALVAALGGRQGEGGEEVVLP